MRFDMTYKLHNYYIHCSQIQTEFGFFLEWSPNLHKRMKKLEISCRIYTA